MTRFLAGLEACRYIKAAIFLVSDPIPRTLLPAVRESSRTCADPTMECAEEQRVQLPRTGVNSIAGESNGLIESPEGTGARCTRPRRDRGSS